MTVYGTSHGGIRADHSFRHVFNPTVTYGYQPDFPGLRVAVPTSDSTSVTIDRFPRSAASGSPARSRASLSLNVSNRCEVKVQAEVRRAHDLEPAGDQPEHRLRLPARAQPAPDAVAPDHDDRRDAAAELRLGRPDDELRHRVSRRRCAAPTPASACASRAAAASMPVTRDPARRQRGPDARRRRTRSCRGSFRSRSPTAAAAVREERLEPHRGGERGDRDAARRPTGAALLQPGRPRASAASSPRNDALTRTLHCWKFAVRAPVLGRNGRLLLPDRDHRPARDLPRPRHHGDRRIRRAGRIAGNRFVHPAGQMGSVRCQTCPAKPGASP